METTKKLNPEFKAKWIAALRSGEYQQCHGTMFKEKTGGYCCLGVAACVQHGFNITSSINQSKDGASFYDLLPSPIAGGFSNPVAKHLMRMNDGTGDFDETSFPEIANWIDANL